MNSEEGEKTMSTATITDEEEGHGWYAMQLVSASVLPMVLKSAIDLGVLEIIGKAGPNALLSTDEIASQLPTAHNNPDHAPIMLDRILRLLASYSILNCSLKNHDGQIHRLYGLAPVAKYFIPNQVGVSLAPMYHLIHDKVMMDMWYHLKDAVLEGGIPFNRAYGMDSRDYAGKDPRLRMIFKDAMSDYNSIFMNKILEVYDSFEGLKSVVDVGGGNGTLLNMIVSKYPTIKGINFDLAPLIEKAPSYPGIQHVAGDMFENIPKGDSIFMKWMLHSWDDEHCLKILKNCYEALPDDGKVMIVDLVVPEDPDTSRAVRSKYQFDLFMMNMNPGGKERTEREFSILAKGAGFSSIRVMCSAYNFSIVEFYKNI